MDIKNPEGQEFNKRVEDFMKEYKELTEKHQIDYVQFPQFQPDGNGAFKIVIATMPVDLNLQKLNQSFIQK